MKVWKLIFGICLVFGIWNLNVAGSAAASTKPARPAPPPTGITLSPAIEQVSIQANEAQHRLEFKIINNEPKTQTINITTDDFNTLEDTGGLVFVGSNPSALQKKYGLANWITLPQTTITVPGKGSTTFTAFILNQPSLSPGGHYGALMLQLADNSTNAGSKNKVSITPIASALLFVDKLGGDTHILQLTDVDVNRSIFNLPSSITLRFKNDGNTHLTPRGFITISDLSGKVVSKGIINENSGIILPESYRRYSVPLSRLASSIRPGNYKLRVDFHFDGYNQFRSYQTGLFLLVPVAVLLVLIFAVGAGIGGFYTFKKHAVHKKLFKQVKRLRSKIVVN